MTEYELNDLIVGQAAIMHQSFQVWAVATTSLAIAAYLVGNKIETSLRRTILVTYTFLALGSIGSWCNSLYIMVRLAQRMADAGMPPPESIPFVGAANALILVLAFLVGTIGSIAYMIKTGREKNP